MEGDAECVTPRLRISNDLFRVEAEDVHFSLCLCLNWQLCNSGQVLQPADLKFPICRRQLIIHTQLSHALRQSNTNMKYF